MQNLFKLFGTSFAGAGVLTLCLVIDANAATSRTTANGAAFSGNRPVSTTGVNRMPTMPTLPINAIGNISPNLPGAANRPGNNGGNDNPGGDNPGGDTPGGDAPGGDQPGGDQPGGDQPGGDQPGGDQPGGDTPAANECPDGGVKDSKYTVTNCMTDVASCINSGALPGGMNDLFNEDVRNSIMTGMNVCSVQVERCVSQVRRNCENVYRGASDVWVDFNARKVQPEYYTFVLRKTGLSPNQAKNTCLLLDKNTYGSAYVNVDENGNVTGETKDPVGAYNGANNNSYSKDNPLGATLNKDQRGQYARWDAATAECHLRVAAYNKDKLITNRWLFGAAGNNQTAEAWKKTGDTFTCNKDLFGFALRNNAKTVLAAGTPAAALAGGAIGFATGHGERDFDCKPQEMREKLTDAIRATKNESLLNKYLKKNVPSFGVMDQDTCEAVVKLYRNIPYIENETTKCIDGKGENKLGSSEFYIQLDCGSGGEYCQDVNCKDCVGDKCNTCKLNKAGSLRLKELCDNDEELYNCAKKLCNISRDDNGNVNKEAVELSYSACYDVWVNQLEVLTDANFQNAGPCWFKSLTEVEPDAIKCDTSEENADGTSVNNECRMSATQIKDVELAEIKKVLDNKGVEDVIGIHEDSNRWKRAGAGAAIGTGVGGLAAGITALVEKGNISCRVGDDLERVGMGKAHTIPSLYDYYVKWNLNLPENVMPTPNVNSCDTWRSSCAALTDLNQCRNAMINYKAANGTTTLIYNACVPSGTACIENYPVARSMDVCE